MVPHVQLGRVRRDQHACVSLRPDPRGDVVALHHDDADAQTFLKRIVALPGERVRIDAGTLSIDGKPLDEPYVSFPDTRSVAANDRSARMRCYVLGDNRARERRFAQLGPDRRRRHHRQSARRPLAARSATAIDEPNVPAIEFKHDPVVSGPHGHGDAQARRVARTHRRRGRSGRCALAAMSANPELDRMIGERPRLLMLGPRRPRRSVRRRAVGSRGTRHAAGTPSPSTAAAAQRRIARASNSTVSSPAAAHARAIVVGIAEHRQIVDDQRPAETHRGEDREQSRRDAPIALVSREPDARTDGHARAFSCRRSRRPTRSGCSPSPARCRANATMPKMWSSRFAPWAAAPNRDASRCPTSRRSRAQRGFVRNGDEVDSHNAAGAYLQRFQRRQVRAHQLRRARRTDAA